MREFVYQFALRRADNEKKDFVIERDLILTEKRFDAETLEAISKKNQCDIQVTFLGQLISNKKEEVINIEYHTNEMIEEILNQWEKEKEHGTN